MKGRSGHVARARAEPILLAEPDPAWAEAFAAEEARLREIMGEGEAGPRA